METKKIELIHCFIVVYKDGTSRLVRNPSEFPDTEERSFKVARLQEPMVNATLIFPEVSFSNNWVYKRGGELKHFLHYEGIHGEID